jgi:hypothetical protein
MNRNWISIGIAAVIAIAIIGVIETLASHKRIPEGNNLIVWLEVAAFGLISASYVVQEIVRAIEYFMELMRGRRDNRHILELRNIVILFGSAFVSAAIYFAFVFIANNGNGPLGGRVARFFI